MKKLILLSALATVLTTSTYSVKATAETDESATMTTAASHIAAQTKNLNPSVLKLAMTAFYNAYHKGIHPVKQILTVIDYSLPSTQKRLWVVDLAQEKVLFTSLCAHGKYSGDNYTTSFSNRPGSLQTSLGLFLTENTYFGHDGYSLKIKGLEQGFNNLAEPRTIVMHGAPYVSAQFASALGRIGRSWGCPAVEPQLAKPIIDTIKDGTLVFAYYPEHDYLQKSTFINYKA
jgi:hypothetical protein